MSYFLQHSKIAAPMGAFALTSASSSILMGRQTSHQTSKKATQTASRYLNSCAQSQLHKYTRHNLPSQNQNQYQYQSRFLSSETSKGAASAAKESSANSSSGGGFVAWYESHLQARPIATKAVTGSILWGLGDIVAQVVPSMIENEDVAPPAQEHDTQLVAKKEDFEYDYPRTARAMFFGFAIHAPLSHVHFNFLEWMTIKGAFTGLSIPIFKTVMEQVRYCIVWFVFI